MHKRSGARAVLRAKPVALAVAAAFLPWSAAHAQTAPNTLPSNGAFAAGTGMIHAPTPDNYLRIDQSSTKGIINWETFSIGSAAHVHFQHDAGRAGVTLNRVTGNSPSEIFGRLSANGQLFLVNNAGVFFAPGASVDVGSILASSLSITDQNFLNGTYQFSNPGSAGSVVNAGSIITANGYAALIGPQVRNDGVIVANAGKVALGAGDRISLSFFGDNLVSLNVDEAAFNASIINTGTLQADGGTVLLKASSANALLDTVINTSGVIRATGLAERNGEIVLDAGPNGGIVSTGLVDASDFSGGAGSVSVTGGSLHVQRVVPDPMFLNGLITGGTVAVDVAGGVTVEHNGQISSQRGQSISADSLTIRAEAGESTSVRNESGEQAVAITGANGILVEVSGGGSAILGKPVFFGGPSTADSQTISATRIDVLGGAIQANEQNISVSGDFSVRNGWVSTGGGNQTITVSGGNMDVRAVAGGTAFIDSGGAQTVLVTDGDHINLVGEAGIAGFQASFGTQTISITGTGANAIRLGSVSATGNSTFNGLNQTITAGNAGESGSIAITGSAGNSATHIANIGVGVANPQTVRTSGNLTVSAGTSGQGRGAGIFQNNPAEQRISAANVTLQAGASGFGNGVFINSTFGGGQSFTVPGELRVVAGAGGAAGIFNGSNTPQTISAPQVISAGSIVLQGGPSGSNNGAFISSSFGGDQTLTVPAEIRVTGGAGGSGNRAGITTNANQTITGNPDILLTGGGGGAAGNGNNVFIQSVGDDTKTQAIDARSVRLIAGPGTDASATLNAARQVIAATGDVSLFGTGGPGSSNGVRIGGLGGSVLGPTNLTLDVGGNLLLHGGTANGASLGSSGASSQSNTIVVNAANVSLVSEGAGARIGSSNQAGATPGSIALTADGSLELGNGTAVRVNGPITLTANRLTNRGAITNGGGANSANTILNANAFDLAAGSIQGGAGAVILRPRTGTNSFGIEAPGMTTLTNADIGSISTSNFVVFGSGLGSFTGSMAIGQNALVDAGQKNLAFFRTGPGATTIGAQGVATAGDVIIGSTSGGSILSNGGIVAGDEVQLRAALGIGLPGAGVRTDANALTIVNSTGGGPLVAGNAFVIEADDVTLRSTSLNVGGNINNASNFVSGSLDFAAGGDVNVVGTVQTLGTMNADIGGALTLDASAQDAVLTSVGGQAISAQSLSLTAQGGRRALIENIGGHQEVGTTAGDMNLQVPGAFGTAQVVSNAAGGNQTIDVSGQLNVLGGAITSSQRNSGLFKIGPGGLQNVQAAGITLQGGASGVGAAALISSQSDQRVDVTGGDINILGGNGGVTNNAAILASATGQQTVLARHINLANGFGGIDTVAAIQGGHQLIDVTGNVTLASQGAILGTAPGGPGVRIGAPQNTPAGTDVTLLVDGNLVIDGGSVADNGAAIGSSGASAPAPNTITIDAGGSVILNAGSPSNTGVRIGSGGNGLAGGNISIKAGGGIELNGTQRSASIRTLDGVSLHADQPGGTISESGNGFVVAGSLTTTSQGSTSLIGPNQVGTFNASAMSGDVSLNNSGALNVTGLNGFNAAVTNEGDVRVTGAWNSFGTAITTTGAGSDLTVNHVVTSSGPMNVDVSGDITVGAAGGQDAMLRSFGGQAINGRSLAVTSNDGRLAAVWNTGPGAQTINASNGAGIDVQTLSAGGFAQISADLGGSQAINVVNGDHINVNGAMGGASIASIGGAQTLSISGGGRNAITVGSTGALGPSVISGGFLQNVTAGLTGEQGSITIVGSDSSAALSGFGTNPGMGGTQTVSTSGTLSITGGRAASQLGNFPAGIFHNGSGAQTINAAAIALTGGPGGGTNVAQIGSFGGGIPANAGHQRINVAGGSITLRGSDSGVNNRASIFSNADQTIDGNPNLVLIGGASAAAGVTNSNSATISAALGRSQTVRAGTITMTNSAGANPDSFAGLNASRQSITTTGDVILTASGGSARIGGQGGGATDLDLTVGGSLILDGGTRSTNGAGIGSSGIGAAFANDIRISALGDVILNSGASGARIGSGAATGTAGGDISISARSIQLTGLGASAAIRTLDSVSLHADQPGGTISESGNAFVLANSLTTSSSGSTNLTGPNQVAKFSASSGGDLAFTNAGNVTVSGVVTSNGAMDLHVAGDIAVVAAGTQDAMLRSFGGQNINARSLSVTSNDGRMAAVWNTGANAQSINLAGGAGLDVQTLSPGGFAQVVADAGSSQAISVTNGDHINVNGIGGAAMIGAFGGDQTLSLTGSGANAMTLGAAGSLGPSSIFGGVQNIMAGAAGESGSITIHGGNANATFTGISSGQIAGGTQTVSTSGAMRITGGDAPGQPPNGFATGLFHNGSGEQRVRAASLDMQGGSSGFNNTAIIISSGGAGAVPSGSQVIEVAGDLALTGGSGGFSNSSIIVSFADQTVTAGSAQLTGGAGGGNNGAFINIAGAGPAGTQLVDIAGDLDIAGGAGGNAGLTGSSARQQTLFADNIRLTNSAAGGVNSVGFILGGHQDIHAAGDVMLTARASGGDLPGVRIGGLAGAAATATDLTLTVGGDLVLTGGSAANNGVGIGSTAAPGVPPLANNITISAGENVILNSGVATSGVRIGSPQTATGPGTIRITAGGDIHLNGLGESAAIRSLGTVALSAERIMEDARGRIIAGALDTTSVGDTLLIGPNQVSSFTAASATGNVSLRNSAPLLTLGSMDLQGSLAMDQTGTLSIPGTVAALSHDFQATGDVLVGSAGATGSALLYAPGDISIATPGSVIVRGSDVTPLAGSAIFAEGELNVAAGNVALTGGAAFATPAVARGERVTMNIGAELTVTGGSGHFSPAVLSSGSNVDLTVGNAVRIDAGSGYLSLARIQTEIRDGVIHISFPNLSEGGYFVNGLEGDTHHGQTGFFTLNKPAKVGSTLQLDYGS